MIFSKVFSLFRKTFASETLLWQKYVLRVAAIDCGDARNFLICNTNQVREYPVFRWFPAYNQAQRGTVACNETSSMQKFMRNAINFLESEPNPPDHWPYLTSYE
jgi:hypothetical protein